MCLTITQKGPPSISKRTKSLKRAWKGASIKLREHLGATVAFMKLSRDYHDFIDKMDTHYPRYGEQYRLPFNYEKGQDDGKGL